jgi:hypothetical protein
MQGAAFQQLVQNPAFLQIVHQTAFLNLLSLASFQGMMANSHFGLLASQALFQNALLSGNAANLAFGIHSN